MKARIRIRDQGKAYLLEGHRFRYVLESKTSRFQIWWTPVYYFETRIEAMSRIREEGWEEFVQS